MVNEEINRCLGCKVKPCVKGCPLGNDITGFIGLMKEGKNTEAFELLSQTTVLSSLCGRICPHEKQCQGSCIHSRIDSAVQIGSIEAALSDECIDIPFSKTNELSGKKVAVVGGGPAGLTCAAFLARKGVEVTVFEKHEKLGGILRYGIPEFRLPKAVLDKTVEKILNIGITSICNKELGKDFTLESLKEEYDAICLAIGANCSRKMRIPGEDLPGVFGANECLEYGTFEDYKGKRVAISGGGNVAMDAARTINKMGAEETIVIYRRSEKEMPAEVKEIAEAKEEGVKFLFQHNILAVKGEGKVESLDLIKTQLVAKEGETRLSPVNIEGSEYSIPMDYIYMAVGSAASPIVKELNLELEWNKIKVNENKATSDKKVFACGDIIDGKGTVAWASRYGRDAAEAIVEVLKA